MTENVQGQRPLLRLNETVPDFEAITTQGKIKLSDFKGKWVILFSHPADFTPVCTTEFVAFAKIHDELVKRNVQLIGLSIDSVYSHIAWVRTIKEKLGVQIPFPVIADLDMKVAHLFGMIHPAASTTAADRCVFIIDPEMTLRATIYYPLNVGRNMQELLRLLDALQTVDKKQGCMPCKLAARRRRDRAGTAYAGRRREAIERRLRMHRLVPLQEKNILNPLSFSHKTGGEMIGRVIWKRKTSERLQN